MSLYKRNGDSYHNHKKDKKKQDSSDESGSDEDRRSLGKTIQSPQLTNKLHTSVPSAKPYGLTRDSDDDDYGKYDSPVTRKSSDDIRNTIHVRNNDLHHHHPSITRISMMRPNTSLIFSRELANKLSGISEIVPKPHASVLDHTKSTHQITENHKTHLNFHVIPDSVLSRLENLVKHNRLEISQFLPDLFYVTNTLHAVGIRNTHTEDLFSDDIFVRDNKTDWHRFYTIASSGRLDLDKDKKFFVLYLAFLNSRMLTLMIKAHDADIHNVTQKLVHFVENKPVHDMSNYGVKQEGETRPVSESEDFSHEEASLSIKGLIRAASAKIGNTISALSNADPVVKWAEDAKNDAIDVLSMFYGGHDLNNANQLVATAYAKHVVLEAKKMSMITKYIVGKNAIHFTQDNVKMWLKFLKSVEANREGSKSKYKNDMSQETKQMFDNCAKLVSELDKETRKSHPFRRVKVIDHSHSAEEVASFDDSSYHGYEYNPPGSPISYADEEDGANGDIQAQGALRNLRNRIVISGEGKSNVIDKGVSGFSSTDRRVAKDMLRYYARGCAGSVSNSHISLFKKYVSHLVKYKMAIRMALDMREGEIPGNDSFSFDERVAGYNVHNKMFSSETGESNLKLMKEEEIEQFIKFVRWLEKTTDNDPILSHTELCFHHCGALKNTYDSVVSFATHLKSSMERRNSKVGNMSQEDHEPQQQHTTHIKPAELMKGMELLETFVDKNRALESMDWKKKFLLKRTCIHIVLLLKNPALTSNVHFFAKKGLRESSKSERKLVIETVKHFMIKTNHELRAYLKENKIPYQKGANNSDRFKGDLSDVPQEWMGSLAQASQSLYNLFCNPQNYVVKYVGDPKDYVDPNYSSHYSPDPSAPANNQFWSDVDLWDPRLDYGSDDEDDDVLQAQASLKCKRTPEGLECEYDSSSSSSHSSYSEEDNSSDEEISQQRFYMVTPTGEHVELPSLVSDGGDDDVMRANVSIRKLFSNGAKSRVPKEKKRQNKQKKKQAEKAKKEAKKKNDEAKKTERETKKIISSTKKAEKDIVNAHKKGEKSEQRISKSLDRLNSGTSASVKMTKSGYLFGEDEVSVIRDPNNPKYLPDYGNIEELNEDMKQLRKEVDDYIRQNNQQQQQQQLYHLPPPIFDDSRTTIVEEDDKEEDKQQQEEEEEFGATSAAKKNKSHLSSHHTKTSSSDKEKKVREYQETMRYLEFVKAGEQIDLKFPAVKTLYDAAELQIKGSLKTYTRNDIAVEFHHKFARIKALYGVEYIIDQDKKLCKKIANRS